MASSILAPQSASDTAALCPSANAERCALAAGLRKSICTCFAHAREIVTFIYLFIILTPTWILITVNIHFVERAQRQRSKCCHVAGASSQDPGPLHTCCAERRLETRRTSRAVPSSLVRHSSHLVTLTAHTRQTTLDATTLERASSRPTRGESKSRRGQSTIEHTFDHT